MTRHWTERGSVAVEVAILTPGLLVLIVLAVVTGRTAIAQGAIDLAAHDGARAASLSRTAAGAQTSAHAAAEQTLAQQGLACTSLSVEVDTSQFTRPVGQPAAVRVTVTCLVSFADVALPGVPGSRQLSATFTSPLDQYRTRALGLGNAEPNTGAPFGGDGR